MGGKDVYNNETCWLEMGNEESLPSEPTCPYDDGLKSIAPIQMFFYPIAERPLIEVCWCSDEEATLVARSSNRRRFPQLGRLPAQRPDCR